MGIDVSSPVARRRFFLDRALRKRTRGAGSDLATLMLLPRKSVEEFGVSDAVFGDVPVCLIGALAAATYAPERMTHDIDYFCEAGNYDAACASLRERGFVEAGSLHFANASLGLYGTSWRSRTGAILDLLASALDWARAAFAAPEVRNAHGARVMPLAFLVLMKLDSARTIDQADLGRMLGRLNEREVEAVVQIVETHYGDSSAAEDIRQFALIGRWEYDSGASDR